MLTFAPLVSHWLAVPLSATWPLSSFQCAAYQLAASDFPLQLPLFEHAISKESNCVLMTSASTLALVWLQLANGDTQPNRESDSNENGWRIGISVCPCVYFVLCAYKPAPNFRII